MSTPAASADRNLLCGILALQMDFVTRDQLVVGMHAWVLDKQKPLGQILLEQNALTSSRHALLEALVQEHVKQHDNDPQKSLAALSDVGSARKNLEQIADADVRASLSLVQCSPHQPEAQARGHQHDPEVKARDGHHAERDEYIPATASVGLSTSSGLRFRILRQHAKGGLGQVFVALDEELHREVALKEIQDKHADKPESRSRFLLEAEITGGLEHPGIVPVYGLGQYADGRPYYAMRFIRGHSLADAIEKYHSPRGAGGSPASTGEPPVPRVGDSLAFRQLLGRFVDVCNAMQYAHDRGVLHRDLKPGNVMLGKYGETLIVDWGLAKPLASVAHKPAAQARDAAATLDEPVLQPKSASGSAETLAGTAIGTPAYMSPEQAAGRLDLLGPASDVYSLGATLYCLLTGKAPFVQADVGETLRKVIAGDLPRPRAIKPDVSEALEAICLKAISLKPADRYATPRMLADDVEHWLADEPVTAWPEPWTVRTRRWLGRHRTLVTRAPPLPCSWA